MSNKKELIDNELYQMIDAYKRHSQPLAQSLAELFDSEFISLEEFNGVVTDEDTLLDYTIDNKLIIFDVNKYSPDDVLYVQAAIAETLYKYVNFYANVDTDSGDSFIDVFEEMDWFDELITDCEFAMTFIERQLSLKIEYELSPLLKDKNFLYTTIRDHYVPDELFIGWTSISNRICARLGSRNYHA